MFELALALDPQSVEARTLLANALVGRVLGGMTCAAAADLARAEGLVGEALTASPRSAHAHYVKGRVLGAQNQWEEAVPEYETALAINRNWVSAYAHLGQCKFFVGSVEEAIPLVEKAIRLSPRDPFIGEYYLRVGVVHLVRSRTEEAIVWLEKARGAMPAHPNARVTLASAYALKGETQRAAAELAEARSLVGDDRYSSVGRLKGIGLWGVPQIRALFETTFFAGLRLAGMPEE
jgi:adenylate cyclase